MYAEQFPSMGWDGARITGKEGFYVFVEIAIVPGT